MHLMKFSDVFCSQLGICGGRYHIVNYVRYRPTSRGVATAVSSNVIELSSGTARLLNLLVHLSLVFPLEELWLCLT